jgi:hypothetical protein
MERQRVAEGSTNVLVLSLKRGTKIRSDQTPRGLNNSMFSPSIIEESNNEGVQNRMRSSLPLKEALAKPQPQCQAARRHSFWWSSTALQEGSFLENDQ